MYKKLAEEFGITIEYHKTVKSTNDLAGEPHREAGTIIVAEHQTNGRGQRGNRWASTAGLNLTFSLVLHPEFLPVNMQFRISKAVALALADTIVSLGMQPKIKWPNDIYIGDKKVAGILIENDIMGKTVSKSIIGIGLNVNQTEFDPALPNPTSLALEAGRTFDRQDILCRIITSMSERYGQLAEAADMAAGVDVNSGVGKTGGRTQTDLDYESLLYRLGEEHTYFDVRENRKFRGIIRGVKPSGELGVEWVPLAEKTNEETMGTVTGMEKITLPACGVTTTGTLPKDQAALNISPPSQNTTGPREEAGRIKYYLFKEIEFVIS